MNFLRYLISKTLFEPRELDLLLATLFLSRGRKVSATEDSKIPLVLFRRNRRVFEDTIVRFVAENTDVQRRWRVGQNLDAESGWR